MGEIRRLNGVGGFRGFWGFRERQNRSWDSKTL